MTENDRSAFAKIMMTLAEVYDKKLTDQFIKLYMAALVQYSIDEIESAAAQIIRTKTFHKFPLPAEFIEILEPPEKIETTAILSLDTVFEAMERYGAYQSIAFDDPIIHAVITYLGGWEKVCLSRRQCTTETTDRFWRKEFCELYRAFRNSDLSGVPDYLPGTYERQNTQSGYVAAGLYTTNVIEITTKQVQRKMLPTNRCEQKRIGE